jgi:hemerythrin
MIEWRDDLLTGVKSIDSDHKFLVSLINSFERMSSDKVSSDHIHAAIMALGEYAENHFRREEALMMVCGYPHYKPHHRSHIEFGETVTFLINLHQKAPSMVSIDGVIAYLQEWLIGHIGVSDQAYVELMRENKDLVDKAGSNLSDDFNFQL